MKTFSFVVPSAAVAGLPAAGTTVTNLNLPKGAAVLVDKTGKRLAAMPATGFVKFAYSLGVTKPLIFTHLVNAATAVSTKQKHISDSQQVTTIGYQNSGTDNLPVINSAKFGIYIRQEQDDFVYGGNCSQPIHMQGQFETAAASSALDFGTKAADAIFASVNNWVSETTNSRPSYCKIELISDGTIGAAVGTGFMVDNGAKTIVALTSVGAIVAGSIISIGATEDLYTVTAVSGLTVTLGQKYRGATDAAAAVSIVAPVANLYGLKFTGIKNEFDPWLFANHSQNSFGVIIQREGEPVAITTTTTQAKWGVGNYELVAQEEKYFMENNTDATLTTFIPNKPVELQSVAGKKYSVVDVKWTNPVDADTPLGTVGRTFGNVRFLLELDGADDVAASTIGDALAETILGTAYTTGDLNA
jgi:hypothetical protein